MPGPMLLDDMIRSDEAAVEKQAWQQHVFYPMLYSVPHSQPKTLSRVVPSLAHRHLGEGVSHAMPGF